MKKYLLPITLICSSSSFAFPAYNSVSCHGIVNGHNTSIEYNKNTHVIKLNVDGNQGASIANEVVIGSTPIQNTIKMVTHL